MIASVTSVVRGGVDLPTSVRVGAPSPAGTTPEALVEAPPAATAPVAVPRTADGRAAAGDDAERHRGEQAAQQRHQRQQQDSPTDVAATSRYVGELVAARITGSSVGHGGRPAHIAPERMAVLISFLEANAEPAAAAPADGAPGPARQGVDVRS